MNDPDLFGESMPSPETPAETKALSGVLERITYANEENGYTVAAFRVDGDSIPTTVVGNLFGANVGESLKLTGRWTDHPRFGQQFKVESFIPTLPASPEAIESYLSSGLIDGVGKVYAKRIVDTFGRETFDILDNEPHRLREAPGIGPKRAATIREAWGRQQAIRDVVMFLQRFDISPAWAVRLYKQYGADAPMVLRDDPFRLAIEVRGIGFASADKIARAAGIAADDPRRIQAGVKHRLRQMADDGHTFAPYDLLEAETADMLGVDPEQAREAVVELYKTESVICEKLPEGDKAVYDGALHRAETNVAQYLRRIIDHRTEWPRIDAEREIDAFQRRNQFQFHERQREALRLALRGDSLTLTGGPGTGKTTTLRGIIEILTHHNIKVALAAPTGRASKRLSETTRMDASTIHRLLKFNPQRGGFTHDESNPIEADLIVIDETSMVDIQLAESLLRAIEPKTSLLFVGDTDQLPSVGPGNFLSDVIHSEAMPVVRLTEIFRQAKQSLIVVNAHRINSGEFPYLKADAEFPDPDFFFIEKNEPEEIRATVRDLVGERIPKRFRLNAVDDTQIITPMRRGDLGASSLNAELQQLLNPNGAIITRGRSAFRVGDKVMQVRNNYDREVFNGDIGRIVKVDEEDATLAVRFDGRTVFFPFDEMDDLQLAYAITVHKSQGSEYPAVVIPIHTQHYVLLQRNLFYTALTRGKRLVCVVGSRRALGIAVNNAKIAARFSGLKQRLRR